MSFEQKVVNLSMVVGNKLGNYYPPIVEPQVETFKSSLVVKTSLGESLDLVSKTDTEFMKVTLPQDLYLIYLQDIDRINRDRDKFNKIHRPQTLLKYSDQIGTMLAAIAGGIAIYKFSTGMSKTLTQGYLIEAFLNGAGAYFSLSLLCTLSPKVREKIRRSK